MNRKSKTPIPPLRTKTLLPTKTVEADPRFNKLCGDMYALWQGIASDAGPCTSAEAVELCLDAGRLTTDGHADSDDYASELIAAYGYEPVEALLVKHTNF